jgi:hypothetical protein
LLTISAKPVGVEAVYQRLIPTGEQSGSQTRIAATESVGWNALLDRTAWIAPIWLEDPLA